ncbi:transmembrane protein 94 isoform X2 [Drosophila sulfurigaster albostrigata]|uniref:transmembrane protein 94 isoform X2 n=1 Tax=Drosophila sulfurigaster albostrigata TaxID=89887 RepID=UPI002D21AEA6|nr:transmembrane protein 94 isoform X2 [Drosophila sulfurigaster albostrigata]
MPQLSEAVPEAASKCSNNDKETAAAAATSPATLPQTAEHTHAHTHSHSHSNASSAAPKENLQRGLSTKVALSRLHEEIEKVLLEHEKEERAESCYCKLRAAFVNQYNSPLGWLSIGATLVTSGALLITGMCWPAICLLAILLLDLCVVIRESNLRRTEIFRKTRHALNELRLAEQHLSDKWQATNYPHLSNPMSPCVSLQWTYRDGHIVNLPWALLVRGDCIVLRPGHISPGPCHELKSQRHFSASEIYGGTAAQLGDPPVKPIARAPIPDLVCCLETTPYLDNLRLCLRNSLNRPPTIYNQQRYLLVTKYIQQWGFITALIITLFAGLLRLHGYGLASDEKHNWRHVLIASPAAAVIPLLPLIFPLLWISMNLWGVARLQCFLKTPQAILEKATSKSFEDLDLDTPAYDYDSISLLRSNVLRIWTQLWQGDSELLPRSANLVQVLGSISALCCVDKKGILSWPNPTAEKVFFLHNTEEEPQDDGSQMSMSTESDNVDDEENKERGIVAEVLDLTHDQHCPFRLEFDDHEWKAHIKSLKPLGLAILLNTCSPLTHEHYAQFCGHVSAVAMLDKDLVPVTNRRCLCELAKQIGFTNHATDRFALEGQLASYRHLQPDVVRRDIRFARQLQLSTKVKVPFPHSLSVVMRENPGGYLSLFTQGTADIILDCCDDFWDGKDLRPLSPQDRKRALDFYQRSALTSYCTAFAYRPLRHGIHGALSGPLHSNGQIAYLELPPESKLRMQHVDKSHCDFEGGHHVKLSHSISTDSLLFSESKDEDCNDVEGCFEMQCHQVFIGMVTMQYQAQNDIVHLVERLERACIRFVHFSKENELRSRVFSEKMGLESGWNCHISLLSEPEPEKEREREKVTISKTKETENATMGNCKSGKLNEHNTTTTKITTSTITDTVAIHLPSSAQDFHGEDAITSTPIDSNTDIVGDPVDGPKLSYLLSPPNNLESSKTLSCSAPGAISNPDECNPPTNDQADDDDELDDSKEYSMENVALQLDAEPDPERHKQRHSLDSAMDENCRSLSTLTESTDQSAPINFDMSNRAKLPRGIENIRPHLEQVDNVPLQVSLFTDCSAQATRQMLDIMQSYGEIVVCLGSSASNDNANIFLQADCSIAVEPLYPQVCQDVDAYTEANILHNKLNWQRQQQQQQRGKSNTGDEAFANEQLLESGTNGSGARAMQSPAHTVSPIYLSRLLNSLPCSIAICRDDPLSLVAIIELSRRFSLGLWNCIQFWACCAGSISILNVLCACLSLPPLITPLLAIYLMCVPVPLIGISLAHIDLDPKIMSRATSKKQTEYDSRAFAFVMWCYGCKFLIPVIATLIAYWMCMTTTVTSDDVEDEDSENITDLENENSMNFYQCLHIARCCALFAVLLHFVLVSITFVHRDHALWQRNPLSNHIWGLTCLALLLLHGFICGLQMLLDESLEELLPQLWLPLLVLFVSSLLSLLVSELAKFQENKVNARYQRRARLDFGTKLGMNSPF